MEGSDYSRAVSIFKTRLCTSADHACILVTHHVIFSLISCFVLHHLQLLTVSKMTEQL